MTADATGTDVNNDWSARQEMMKTKDDTDPDEHHKRWQMMVEMAADDMEPFQKDAAELEPGPVCPVA